MNKLFLSLLLTAITVTSIKPAEQAQPNSSWLRTVCIAGAGLISMGLYGYMTAKKEKNKILKSQLLTPEKAVCLAKVLDNRESNNPVISEQIHVKDILSYNESLNMLACTNCNDAIGHLTKLNISEEINLFSYETFKEEITESHSRAKPYLMALVSKRDAAGRETYTTFNAQELNHFIFQGPVGEKQKMFGDVMKTTWETDSETAHFKHQDTMIDSEKGLIPVLDPLTREPLWPGNITYFAITPQNDFFYICNGFDLIVEKKFQDYFLKNKN